MSDADFPTTRWSLVDRLGHSGAGSHFADFLSRYRPALLAYMERRLGRDRGLAEDMVQGFIADKILQDQLLQQADAGRGRLRSFLIRSLRNYAANHARAGRSAKRHPSGGLVSLDAAGAREVPGDEAGDVFDTEWARSLLTQCLQRTEAECESKGMQDCWAVFVARVVGPMLEGEPVPAYEDLIQTLGFASPAEAGNRLTTAKRMFARNLRAIISEYVSDPVQVDRELADLQAALSRSRA